MSDHSGAADRGEEKLAADSATAASDRVSDETAAIDIGEPGVLGIVEEKDVDVPMRDGVLLRANVFRPDAQGEFPAILLRTPYRKPSGGYERFVRAGYAVVTQDSRGRYASDGEYIPFTEEHTGDAEDGYDSVEWLAAQDFCNGRVGTMGASYNAWMQWQLARLRPPHLVAMCAYTIPLELTAVDWPGGFRPGRRVKWWMTSMAPDIRRRLGEAGPHTPEEARKAWDEVDQGHWLGFLPWLELPRYLPKGMAEHAEDWLRHPNRKAWRFEEAHREVEVPNLDFSGWYDHCNDTMRHLAGMQKNGRTELARTQFKLVAGPWSHPTLGQRKVGDIDFGPQAPVDLDDMMIRWFDHWLKGLPNGVDREPAMRYFVMGCNQWRHADSWPPPQIESREYRLGSGGNAGSAEGDGVLEGSEQSGGANDGGTDSAGERNASSPALTDSYVYDPRDPVPTLWSRELFTSPADRRVLEHRKDILYFRSAPLEKAVEIAGYPEVVLFASSTAPDTDFFARLIDEYPDGEGDSAAAPDSSAKGKALEVSYGLVRARHRNSLDVENFLTPMEVVAIRIKLGPTACRFLQGHRIRLEITSSDFPNHDRNHNTGRNDLADTELVSAQQTVYHTSEYPSRLILPVDSLTE